HPDDPGADRDRLIDNPASRLLSAKDIDHVDRFRHLGKRAVNPFVIDRAAGGIGIDRDHPIAAPLQIGHDAVARSLASWAGADDCDCARAFEDATEIVVGIALVVQSGPQRSCQTGSRLARNASMPSPASPASMFVVMTSAAYR